jgi:hypothetical protein
MSRPEINPTGMQPLGIAGFQMIRAIILFTFLTFLTGESGAAPLVHRVCGVAFQAGQWSVSAETVHANGDCHVTVAPPDLAEILEKERDDEGQVTDRYTIEVTVTRESADSVKEWFERASFNLQPRKARGWRIYEDLDYYGRLYYEKEGYCCLSSMPVAILARRSLTVAVIGSVEGELVYKRIVATLRSAPK